MRKIMLVLSLCGTALLAGCETTGSGSTDVSAAIAKVKEATAKICAFVPTTQTIINIFNAGGKYADYVNTAAQICAALNTVAGSRKKVRTPFIVVNGKRIPISGKYVRR